MEQGNSLLIELVKKTAEDALFLEKRIPSMQVFVKGMVWDRISHGLFDYESNEISRNQFSFKTNGTLIRDDKVVKFINKSNKFINLEEDEEDPSVLAHTYILSDDELIIQQKDETQPLNNRIWLVVRSLKLNELSYGYVIQPNDVIKIGRVILRVTEIHTDN
jgi:hypothetical protein